jgi:hypothetical protein
MNTLILWGILISLFLFCSCDWVAHKFKFSMEVEDVVLEAAKEEIEMSKKLAEKELAEPAK